MVTIRLLGPPAVERDGRPAPAPRGRKAWALLCYLLLADRPPGRRQLAELLFADAADPLGALRWSLAELRRVVGPGAGDAWTEERSDEGGRRPGGGRIRHSADLFTGDPVDRALPAGYAVDVRDGDLLTLDGDLLDGIHVAGAAAFEAWLLVERHRVAAAIEARLRAAAVAALAAGRPGDAVPYAARAVARNPLEEGNHELLVRGLAMTGDRAAAERQVAAYTDLVRRELGTEPSPALREAAATSSASPSTLPLRGRAAAQSQLDAGRAAIAAGAVDAGLDCLRRAVSEAASFGDAALRGRALAALGGALVHAVRGRDEEGAVVLHEAIAQATRAGDRATAVTAYRELGFVEVQAGRRATAESWLATATEAAETDEELAAILGVRGMNASDAGDYAAAFEHLDGSVTRAARCGDHRQHAWSLSIQGRAHLLRGEEASARYAVDASLRLVQDQRWIAFQPWPQSLRAELDLRAGDLTAAADGLEHAWGLACQLGDPCWEGMAARGLGLLHARRGDGTGAGHWHDTAASRCARVTDRYQWVHGHVLDTAIGAALDRGEPDRAATMLATLGALAARCDLRELVVRAHVHRHRLGDPAALSAARLLAADIDNPVLVPLLSVSPDRSE